MQLLSASSLSFTASGMKRPLSPTPLVENGLSGASSDLGNVSEPHPTSSEQRAKREKKHQTYTLCEVCNIQLNSPAQAQIHYNGKSHQKRLKQINKGKPASSQGMKRPLSPTPLVENGLSGASSDLGNVSEPHPTSSEQRAKREKKHQTYTLCEVCNIQLNSPAQAQIHYNGKSHQKRLKQINKGKPASSQDSSKFDIQ
ncbi:UNVERIFIED_CONTAM: hypothetical protein FKN15_000535 [Acipenser sinensis]